MLLSLQLLLSMSAVAARKPSLHEASSSAQPQLCDMYVLASGGTPATGAGSVRLQARHEAAGTAYPSIAAAQIAVRAALRVPTSSADNRRRDQPWGAVESFSDFIAHLLASARA